MINLSNLVSNKWFKFFKYLLTSLLVMTSVISLFSAWYTGHERSIEEHYRIANLIFGFLGLILSIISFANSKKEIVIFASFVLVVVFFVLTLTFGSIGIADTTWAPVPSKS